jgi:hypothetical protein
MKKKLLLAISILFYLTNLTAQDQEVLWLSNLPPGERQNEIKANGMHKLSSISAGRGKVKLVQWICHGNQVLNSNYLLNSEHLDAELYCFSPLGDLQACGIDSSKVFKEISFGNQIEGYYNLYLIQKSVRNDTLFVQAAKAELLNHSCRNGHKDVDKKIMSHIHPEKIPIEITRTRTRLENLHFFVSSGDKITYQVSSSSEPLVNASVTFNTQQGWQKTIKSNAEGEAVLQVIQDYFTPWEEIDNRNIYNYLVVAEYTGEEGGTYQGQSYRYTHYTATLSDGYYPSKLMYSSLSWALGIFLFVSLLIGGGVAYHRKRRRKVYREIQLTNA